MRVLKAIFAVVGTLAALLAISIVVMTVVFYTPGASGRALWGIALYFGIAIACFYAFFRIKRATSSVRQRGFEEAKKGQRGEKGEAKKSQKVFSRPVTLTRPRSTAAGG